MVRIIEKIIPRPQGVELRYDYRPMQQKGIPFAWASDAYKELVRMTC